MERIERIATDFGMKMGPLRIMDEIGLDVVMHAGWVLFKAFPDRVPNSPILVKLVELGRLGRKTGRGFMLYPSATSWDGNGQPDPELPSLLGLDVSATPSMSDTEIIERLFCGMADEALRCLDDGIITDPADADLASIHALGFPAEHGGVLEWGKM
jgi:3-hydroxyacyl-CoA dehydrogenase